MKVNFVCFGNVGRSQMAKGFYNHFANTNDADSTGVDETENFSETVFERVSSAAKTHPDFAAIFFQSMLDKGIDMTGYTRQKLVPDMLANYDLIVNIAERSQTPNWLRGENVIWWDIKDPGKTKTVESWLSALEEIESRVKKLIEIENSGGDFHELDDSIDKEYDDA